MATMSRSRVAAALQASMLLHILQNSDEGHITIGGKVVAADLNEPLIMCYPDEVVGVCEPDSSLSLSLSLLPVQKHGRRRQLITGTSDYSATGGYKQLTHGGVSRRLIA